MKLIITGMNGTVAPVVAKKFSETGSSVVPWNRNEVPIDNFFSMKNFIENVKPEWILHFATGSCDWVEDLAKITAAKNINFFFASSASVFSGNQQSPITTDELPDAADDYGKYKIECEKKALINQRVLICRLAWQIGNSPGSNNMIDYIYKNVNEKNEIFASRNWYPSCAFLDDTAEVIYDLVKNKRSGVFHLNGNPDLNMFDIVTMLNAKLGGKFIVRPSDEPVYDNRMRDDRIKIITVKERLKKFQ